MKTLPLITFVGATSLVFAETSAQTTEVLQTKDIARVVTVTKGGVCEACPAGHQEQRRPLNQNAYIKADEWVHCIGSAKGTAVYLSEDGKDRKDGQFELAGEDWEPVALPGASIRQQPGRTRLGTYGAVHTPDNAVVGMSGGAGAAADVEQRAQILPTEPSTRAHKHLAANKADRKLDSSVNKALARADGLDAQNIHVQAKNGEVTLHGSVPEQSQINRATDVASGVKGVTSVKNALKSEPAGN